jgi:hypothetical protein
MPQHLHRLLNLNHSDIVKVALQGRASVMLMDDRNYRYYNEGADFDYFGQLVKRSPCHLKAPFPGRWHLVIEQADPAGDVMAHVQIIRD